LILKQVKYDRLYFIFTKFHHNFLNTDKIAILINLPNFHKSYIIKIYEVKGNKIQR